MRLVSCRKGSCIFLARGLCRIHQPPRSGLSTLLPPSDEAKGQREGGTSPAPHLSCSESRVGGGCWAQSSSPTHPSSTQLQPAFPMHTPRSFPPQVGKGGWKNQGTHTWYTFLLSFCCKPRDQHPCKPSLGARSHQPLRTASILSLPHRSRGREAGQGAPHEEGMGKRKEVEKSLLGFSPPSGGCAQGWGDPYLPACHAAAPGGAIQGGTKHGSDPWQMLHGAGSGGRTSL